MLWTKKQPCQSSQMSQRLRERGTGRPVAIGPAPDQRPLHAPAPSAPWHSRGPLPHPPIAPGTGPASWTPAGSALSRSPGHPHTSECPQNLSQAAWGLGSSSSSCSPIYTTSTPLAVGCCPRVPMLVTVCLPANRVLSISPAGHSSSHEGNQVGQCGGEPRAGPTLVSFFPRQASGAKRQGGGGGSAPASSKASAPFRFVFLFPR